MTIKVAASILSADFSNLAGELKKCEDAGVDIIHLDIMDGHFVPNLTFGPVVVEAIRRRTKLPLDAHLMIKNPERYLAAFIEAGADIITVHAECYPLRDPVRGGCSPTESLLPAPVAVLDIPRLKRDLQLIKSFDAKAAVAINPGTPLCISELLSEIDMVLVMSVNPGFAGQKFIELVLPKIGKLRSMYKGDIGVDGGINNITAKPAAKAGANILVTASYFFSSPDKKKVVEGLKAADL